MRYLKLFLTLLKNNLIREMEFRTNFLSLMVIDFLWVGVQILILTIYFDYTNSILGWTKLELFALMGEFRIIRGFFDVLIRKNFRHFPNDISRGLLDYSLTRPINSLFLISFREHQFSEVGSIIAGLAMLLYSLININPTSLPFILSILPILTFLGLLVFYSFMLFFTTFAIYTTRLTALSSIYDIFSSMLRFPTDVLTFKSPAADLMLVPLAIIVTLPIKILLSKTTIAMFSLEIFIAVSIFLLAYLFWSRALRRYSSASS